MRNDTKDEFLPHEQERRESGDDMKHVKLSKHSTFVSKLAEDQGHVLLYPLPVPPVRFLVLRLFCHDMPLSITPAAGCNRSSVHGLPVLDN